MFSKKPDKARSKQPLTGEVYERARWKHYTRWAAFLMVILFDLLFLRTSLEAHFVRHIPVMPREILGYLLLIFPHAMLLPSIILEVDKVVVTPDKIILNNLVWRFTEAWSDIKSFKQPVFLKFAILKGRKFFYLINKRDIQRYDQLVETIEHKADRLLK